MAYYVYILKSLVTVKFYVGSTKDLEARLVNKWASLVLIHRNI